MWTQLPSFTLGPDLLATVLGEGRAHDPPMLAQQLAERAIADLGHELGRALDVAEPERAQPGLLTHAATMRAAGRASVGSQAAGSASPAGVSASRARISRPPGRASCR